MLYIYAYVSVLAASLPYKIILSRPEHSVWANIRNGTYLGWSHTQLEPASVFSYLHLGWKALSRQDAKSWYSHGASCLIYSCACLCTPGEQGVLNAAWWGVRISCTCIEIQLLIAHPPHTHIHTAHTLPSSYLFRSWDFLWTSGLLIFFCWLCHSCCVGCCCILVPVTPGNEGKHDAVMRRREQWHGVPRTLASA